MHLRITVLASLLLSANFSWAVNKGAEGLGPQELALLNEYEEQYEKLKDFYNNIYLEAVSTEFRPYVTSEKSASEIDAPSENVRLVYRANGGNHYRMDTSASAPDKQSLEAMLKVTLVRPEGYLRARRDSSERGFAIRNISSSFEEGVSKLTAHRFQWVPYTMYGIPMEWFLFREPTLLSSYQITRVSAQKVGSDELATVEMNGISVFKKGLELFGTFVFHRDKMWALKEYTWGRRPQELEADEYRIHKGKFQYANSDSPILKRAEYWVENGSGVKTGFETYDITKAKPGPVPLEEFTLEAIQAAGVAPHRNNWTTRLLVLLAGVACIAVYVILRRRSEAA